MDLSARQLAAFQTGTAWRIGDWTETGRHHTICADARAAGYQIVVTNGCFDLLHPGHMSLLHFCAEGVRGLGVPEPYLLVLLNSDYSVEALKGHRRPVVPFAERAFALARVKGVHGVIGFHGPSPVELLEVLRPDVLVKGQEYEGVEVVGAQYATRVLFAPMLEGWSTTALLARLAAKVANSRI